MSRTARLWRGAGFLMLGSLLPGVSALAADDPPLSTQLTELGRQALAQGAAPTAETFFQKALLLDPNNKLAAQGLEKSKQGRGVVRVAMQDPATPPAVPAAPAPGVGVGDQPVPAPPDTRATIEQTQAAESLARAAHPRRRAAAPGRPTAHGPGAARGRAEPVAAQPAMSSAPRSTCRRPIARPSSAASRRR